ncbi:MAG: hypothetical protein AB4058_00060 [Microcystaceae cyanobacterium]
MNNEDLLLLIGEMRESLKVLAQINNLYQSYHSNFTTVKQRDLRDAVLLADILCNSYTCVETILFRIARVFENHLEPNQWHKELLRKMHIEIPNIRKAVLSKDSYQLLDELRRFRHFKRYYYDFDYDWSRLDYLRSVYDKLIPLIKKEFNDYINFLLECANIDPS